MDLALLTGRRRGPYCSFNPVSRTQVWQWCSAMGDDNPLYLDDAYRRDAGLGDAVVAPPTMMQMWTMRDVNMRYAPGSTDQPPYEIFDVLAAQGFPGNVAVSYDLRFLKLLREGDRAHHYNTIESISELKSTALGEGHFVVERAEFLDQDEELFAEALITYFQYRPAREAASQEPAPAIPPLQTTSSWEPDWRDLDATGLAAGQALPELAIPITHKLIVSCAIASQDFIDVHHNAPAARDAAMPDIFMNILTTCGLSGRYLTDWAGPGSRLRHLALKLLAPNTPGDTMVMRGKITSIAQAVGETLVEVEFRGDNHRGSHVTGSAALALPA